MPLKNPSDALVLYLVSRYCYIDKNSATNYKEFEMRDNAASARFRKFNFLVFLSKFVGSVLHTLFIYFNL